MDEFRPTDGKTYKTFSTALVLANKCREAIMFVNKFQGEKPKRAQLMLERIVKMVRQGSSYGHVIRTARVQFNFEPCLDYQLHLVYYMLGHVYHQQHELQDATDCYLKAQELLEYIDVPDYEIQRVNRPVICELFPISLQRRIIIDALANVYIMQGRYAKGLPYYRKSLDSTFKDKSMKTEAKMWKKATDEEMQSVMRQKRRGQEGVSTKKEITYPVHHQMTKLLEINTSVEVFGDEELVFA
jgi:tetratricopeptide (TPR) repeat protein